MNGPGRGADAVQRSWVEGRAAHLQDVDGIQEWRPHLDQPLQHLAAAAQALVLSHLQAPVLSSELTSMPPLVHPLVYNPGSADTSQMPAGKGHGMPEPGAVHHPPYLVDCGSCVQVLLPQQAADGLLLLGLYQRLRSSRDRERGLTQTLSGSLNAEDLVRLVHQPRPPELLCQASSLTLAALSAEAGLCSARAACKQKLCLL